MVEGEYVVTRINLPGHPKGVGGHVKEVGRFFVAVEFEDGQRAYYRACQLHVLSAERSDSDDQGPWEPPVGRNTG